MEFRGVVLAYRDGLPNALDGVSLVVRPGEKVGIVGRTGSGKSTLFLALFRMVELNQGQILLDGLDISTVGLAQLRYARGGEHGSINTAAPVIHILIVILFVLVPSQDFFHFPFQFFCEIFHVRYKVPQREYTSTKAAQSSKF